MRVGFVLDWKIWMGCFQSSVILHIHTQLDRHTQIYTHTQKQIKKHVMVFVHCWGLCSCLSVFALTSSSSLRLHHIKPPKKVPQLS